MNSHPTADLFATPDGCRAYAAHIGERIEPRTKLDATADATRRLLLRLALRLESDRWLNGNP